MESSKAQQPILEVNDLKTHFHTDEGVVKSVDGVSFSMNSGETVAIVGESGCGKSMTALSIIGLVPPEGEVKGEITFNGENLAEMTEKQMRKIRGNSISMISQDPSTSLNPLMKTGIQVSESIRLHQNLNKEKSKEKAIEILRNVGIADAEKVYSSYPHTLSGGMKQRVMIAIALSCNPQLIIADEPTTALDVTIQAQILSLLNEIKEKTDTAAILISHDLGVVAEMADSVIVLYSGEIVEKGDVYSIYKEPKHPYTQGLLHSTPRIDEEDKFELPSIDGAVPSPLDQITGCKFSSRCKHAMDICKTKNPELLKQSDGRYVKCWLYDDQESITD